MTMVSLDSSLTSLRLIVLLDVLVTLMGIIVGSWDVLRTNAKKYNRLLLTFIFLWNLILLACLIPYLIHFQNVYDRLDRVHHQRFRPLWILLVVLLIFVVVRTLGCAVLLFMNFPPTMYVFTTTLYLVLQGYATGVLTYLPVDTDIRVSSIEPPLEPPI